MAGYDYSVEISDKLTFHWAFTSHSNEDDSLKAMVVLDSSAWVSWGVASSSSGEMVGSEVIIGYPSAGTVEKYDLTAYSMSGVDVMDNSSQTLRSTDILQEDGVTSLSFVKTMAENGELEILSSGSNTFIWAYGSSNTNGIHKEKGSVSLDLGSCDASVTIVDGMSTTMVLMHAMGLLVAWAILVPAGVLVSALRRRLGRSWLKIHIALVMTGVLLTVLGIVVAYVMVEDTTAAEHLNGKHPKIGAFLGLLSMVQVLGGAMRPKPPDADAARVLDIIEKKTLRRFIFEVGHQLYGLCLLIFGAVAIWSGFERALTNEYIGEEYTILRLGIIIPLGVVAISALLRIVCGMPAVPSSNNTKQQDDDQEVELTDVY